LESFVKPIFKSVILLPTKNGENCPKMSKMGKFTVKLAILDIFGQFYPFLLLKELPI
jgi:hypothetical protein